MKKNNKLVIIVLFSLAILIFSRSVFAGRLFIKPALEIKRAERLLDEADLEFRNAKLHINLSPEISIDEFRISKTKLKDAIEIIEKYGGGFYTPGDVDDFTQRMKECDMWIRRCESAIRDK